VLGELIDRHFHRQPTRATFGINEMSLSMSWAVDESGIDELAVDESGIDQSPLHLFDMVDEMACWGK
jgi:hypothetical protein